MSNIRLRDCIIKIDDAFKTAKELGHNVIGFTDHETVSSWMKIEQVAKKYPEIKTIRGNEIYLCRNGLNAENYNREVDRYYHFILLAKDLVGAKQIMEISTRAWIRSYMARGMRRVPTYYQDLFDIIGANPGHVIGMTACLGGALPTQILRGTDREKLNRWINQMISIFGKDDFYLEMQPNKDKDQIKVNRELLTFAREHGLKYVITTDSHYLQKNDRIIHKAYLNAQNGDREVDGFYATTYMMDTEELESYMKYSFEDLEIVRAAYDTIEEIRNKCEDFSLQKPLKIPELQWKDNEPLMGYKERLYLYEKMPTLKKFATSKEYSDQQLVEAVLKGIENHKDLQNEEAYTELEDNLARTWESSEVNNARWSAYFLNLQKIIEECWNAGTIVGPSRGSGGGFLLLYCLDIIQMNSLRETTKCFPWRFLNPKRESVLDIDTDIEGSKRDQVLRHLRDTYGEDRVANVATFRTEKSKSAVLTAARGLGIDVDIAQYIASLIPADRGQLRSLDQCMNGDEENGWAPIKQFQIEMTQNYPELWSVARGIEGIICGSGIHAGGIIFVDEPFTESTGLMRAPDGTICTAFELHDAESASLIKMDLLSVEAMDKIHICIDLLCEYGYAERKSTLRETYESIVGLYNLERNDLEMWDMVLEHKINSLFQMEKQSGINGIALSKPKSVDELAVLNSVIRLMAPEKGAEQPLDMWARYRRNINEWYKEMEAYGLSSEQIKWLSENNAITNGVCESQEGLMSLLQDERLGGNDLSFADKCRKAIAKKQGKLFEECEKEYFKNAEEKDCDMTLVHYVWDVLLRVQRGYSFCRAHTLAYSLIALQEMNLARKYPIIFWNCACLISDAGGSGEDEIDEEAIEENKVEESYSNEMEEFNPEDDEEEDNYEEEDCDGYPAEVITTTTGKKKKKVKATNYGKISAAIGKIQSAGVTIYPPDINKSTFTFSPDVESNAIRFGLSGISRVGLELVGKIIANRPYTSIVDFMDKVKVNKLQMINLIKAGAFDCFGNRVDVMREYVDLISDTKKRITLQNMKMLIEFGLIPEEYDLQRRVFNFNKYLKKQKSGNYYLMDEVSFNFYSKNFDIDILLPTDESESGFKILQVKWDSIYQSQMDIIRPYIKANNIQLLEMVNSRLTYDVWEKYCKGSLSKWEMDSISCYIHPHELFGVDYDRYGWSRFGDLAPEPRIDRYIPIKGKMVPIFKLDRIVGTVLDRDKSKKTVTILTEDGVVTVKIYGVFQAYDKQISERGADGHKHVIRKSEFSRGNILVVTGVRDGDNEFRAKVYKNTPFHHIETVGSIVNGNVTMDNRNGDDSST